MHFGTAKKWKVPQVVLNGSSSRALTLKNIVPLMAVVAIESCANILDFFGVSTPRNGITSSVDHRESLCVGRGQICNCTGAAMTLPHFGM